MNLDLILELFDFRIYNKIMNIKAKSNSNLTFRSMYQQETYDWG
jgi:hypothetical protein